MDAISRPEYGHAGCRKVGAISRPDSSMAPPRFQARARTSSLGPTRRIWARFLAQNLGREARPQSLGAIPRPESGREVAPRIWADRRIQLEGGMINNPSEFPPFELVAVVPNTRPLPNRECMCGGRQLTKNNVCWARSARCHDIQPSDRVANQDCRKYRSRAQGRTCVCISIARAVMSPRTSEQLAQMLLRQRTVAPRSSCMWRGLGTRRARGHVSLVLLGARVCEQARPTRRMNAARVGLERARARCRPSPRSLYEGNGYTHWLLARRGGCGVGPPPDGHEHTCSFG